MYHCMRFREQSKRSKWFNSNKNVYKHAVTQKVTDPAKGHREKKISSAHEKPSRAHYMLS